MSPSTTFRAAVALLLVVAGIASFSGCSAEPAAQQSLLLESPDKEQRIAALRQLEQLGPQAATAVPAVTKCLSDPEADVRRMACVVLRAVGEAGQPALPKLTPLLGDGDFSVRLAAAFAMQKLAPERREFVPVFAEAVRKGGAIVIVEIGELGPAAEWAVPSLVEALKGTEGSLPRLAAEALGKIGPKAREAIPDLEKAARSKDERVSAAAKTALQSVRATTAP